MVVVVVFVTIFSVATIACGTTATEFAIKAAVSLLTAFGSAGASFDDFDATRLVRVVRCVAAGAGDSSVIVLKFF